MANNVGPLYAKNNLADVNSVDTARNSLSVAPVVANRTALKALDILLNDTAILEETGRFGLFLFDAADLSAEVAIDTAEGDYIPPASDVTGASGAWVRSRKAGEDYLTSEFGDDIVCAMNVCELRGGGRVKINKVGTIQLPAGGVVKPSTVGLVGMGSGVTILGCANYVSDSDYLAPAPSFMGGSSIMICADGNNYQMAALPSFTALGIGEANITFASAHGLAVGDEICLYDGNNSSFSAYRTYYRRGERHYVIGVNGLTVYLSGSLTGAYTYSAGIVEAFKVFSWGGDFGGFTLDCSDAFTDVTEWIGIKVFRAAKGANIFDIEILAARSTGIDFDQCFDITPQHIRASCRLDGTGSTNQYPILMSNVTDTVVSASFGRSTWAGFDIGGWDVPGACQSYRSGYRDCVSATLGTTFAGNMHGNTQNCFYYNCDLDGGIALSGYNFRSSKNKIRIDRGSQVVACYATEIVGGKIEILDCSVYSDKDGGATSFGALWLNVEANAGYATEFVVRNLSLDAQLETRPIYLDSASTSFRASLSLDGVFNCPSMAATGLVLALNTGGAAAANDYVTIFGVSGVQPADLLYTFSGYEPTYKLIQVAQTRIQTSGTNLDLGTVDTIFLNYAAPTTISTFTNAIAGKQYTIVNIGSNAVTIDRTNAFLDGSVNQVLDLRDVVTLVGWTTSTTVTQMAPRSNNG